jgi:hypothetical protein
MSAARSVLRPATVPIASAQHLLEKRVPAADVRAPLPVHDLLQGIEDRQRLTKQVRQEIQSLKRLLSIAAKPKHHAVKPNAKLLMKKKQLVGKKVIKGKDKPKSSLKGAKKEIKKSAGKHAGKKESLPRVKPKYLTPQEPWDITNL